MEFVTNSLKRKNEETVHWCKKCSNGFKKKKLHLYQMNLEEAIYMCPVKECLYPMTEKNICDFIVKRNYTDIPLINKKPKISSKGVIKKQKQFSVQEIPSPLALSPTKSVSSSESTILYFDNYCDDLLDFSSVLSPMSENNIFYNLDMPTNSTPIEPKVNNVTENENKFWDDIISSVSNENSSEKKPNSCLSFDDLLDDNDNDNLSPSFQIFQPDDNCHQNNNTDNNSSMSDNPSDIDIKSESEKVGDLNYAIKNEPVNNCFTNMSYPIWKNKDSLCWLDSSLCLLIHNQTLKNFIKEFDGEVCIKKLFKTYEEVLLLSNDTSQQIENHVIKTLDENTKCKITSLMNKIREEIFLYLHKIIKCKKGDEDSPVFVLPLIFRENETVENMFMFHYTWELLCTKCSKKRVISVQKIIPTFPSICEDFSLLNACFLRSCFFCNAPNQKMHMKFDRLPPFLMIHFVEGLPNNDISQYDTVINSDVYKVTGIIQYQLNPKHFITWIRNHKDNLWLCCDDLLVSNTTRYTAKQPVIHPKELHVLMWEKQEKYDDGSHQAKIVEELLKDNASVAVSCTKENEISADHVKDNTLFKTLDNHLTTERNDGLKNSVEQEANGTTNSIEINKINGHVEKDSVTANPQLELTYDLQSQESFEKVIEAEISEPILQKSIQKTDVIMKYKEINGVNICQDKDNNVMEKSLEIHDCSENLESNPLQSNDSVICKMDSITEKGNDETSEQEVCNNSEKQLIENYVPLESTESLLFASDDSVAYTIEVYTEEEPVVNETSQPAISNCSSETNDRAKETIQIYDHSEYTKLPQLSSDVPVICTADVYTEENNIKPVVIDDSSGEISKTEEITQISDHSEYTKLLQLQSDVPVVNNISEVDSNSEKQLIENYVPLESTESLLLASDDSVACTIEVYTEEEPVVNETSQPAISNCSSETDNRTEETIQIYDHSESQLLSDVPVICTADAYTEENNIKPVMIETNQQATSNDSSGEISKTEEIMQISDHLAYTKLLQLPSDVPMVNTADSCTKKENNTRPVVIETSNNSSKVGNETKEITQTYDFSEYIILPQLPPNVPMVNTADSCTEKEYNVKTSKKAACNNNNDNNEITSFVVNCIDNLISTVQVRTNEKLCSGETETNDFGDTDNLNEVITYDNSEFFLEKPDVISNGLIEGTKNINLVLIQEEASVSLSSEITNSVSIQTNAGNENCEEKLTNTSCGQLKLDDRCGTAHKNISSETDINKTTKINTKETSDRIVISPCLDKGKEPLNSRPVENGNSINSVNNNNLDDYSTEVIKISQDNIIELKIDKEHNNSRQSVPIIDVVLVDSQSQTIIDNNTVQLSLVPNVTSPLVLEGHEKLILLNPNSNSDFLLPNQYVPANVRTVKSPRNTKDRSVGENIKTIQRRKRKMETGNCDNLNFEQKFSGLLPKSSVELLKGEYDKKRIKPVLPGKVVHCISKKIKNRKEDEISVRVIEEVNSMLDFSKSSLRTMLNNAKLYTKSPSSLNPEFKQFNGEFYNGKRNTNLLISDSNT